MGFKKSKERGEGDRDGEGEFFVDMELHKIKKNAFSVERPAMSGKHCHVTVLPSSTKFILDGVVLLSNIVKVDTVNM